MLDVLYMKVLYIWVFYSSKSEPPAKPEEKSTGK